MAKNCVKRSVGIRANNTRGGIEIDVGLKFSSLEHQFGDPFAHLNHLGSPIFALSIWAMRFRCGARGSRFCNPMPDAHDFLLLLQGLGE